MKKGRIGEGTRERKSRTVRIKDWEKGGEGMNIRLTDREGKKVELSENGEQRCC